MKITSNPAEDIALSSPEHIKQIEYIMQNLGGGSGNSTK